MKKTALLAACLAAASVGAQAQSTVQLMGQAAFGKDILLFNDASQIPEGENYEVWFEGDYEAHLTKKAP